MEKNQIVATGSVFVEHKFVRNRGKVRTLDQHLLITRGIYCLSLAESKLKVLAEQKAQEDRTRLPAKV